MRRPALLLALLVGAAAAVAIGGDMKRWNGPEFGKGWELNKNFDYLLGRANEDPLTKGVIDAGWVVIPGTMHAGAGLVTMPGLLDMTGSEIDFLSGAFLIGESGQTVRLYNSAGGIRVDGEGVDAIILMASGTSIFQGGSDLSTELRGHVLDDGGTIVNVRISPRSEYPWTLPNQHLFEVCNGLSNCSSGPVYWVNPFGDTGQTGDAGFAGSVSLGGTLTAHDAGFGSHVSVGGVLTARDAGFTYVTMVELDAGAVYGGDIRSPSRNVTFGTWVAESDTSGAVVEDRNMFPPFRATSAGGFGLLACTWTVAGAGGATGVVMSVYNVTDATVVCSCNLGACNSTAYDPLYCSCNSPFLAGKNYAGRVTSATDCAANPQLVHCSVEIVR